MMLLELSKELTALCPGLFQTSRRVRTRVCGDPKFD